MADLPPGLPPGLAQLAAELGAETTPPPFRDLVERAGVRRRRRAAGAVVAVVVVMIAAASGISLVGTHRSAAPIGPAHHHSASPSTSRHHRGGNAYGWIAAPKKDSWWAMTPAQRVHWVVSGGVMADYAVDERGDTLTILSREQKGTQGTGDPVWHQAWALTTADSSHVYAALAHGQEQVRAVAGGFLLSRFDRSPILIGLDGSATPLPLRAPAAGSVAPGDLLFTHGAGLAVADPVSRTWWRLAVPSGAALPLSGSWAASSVVGTDGSYWLVRDGGERSPGVTLLREPCASSGCAHTIAHGWKQGAGLGGLLASGSRVAAFTTGDGVDAPVVIRWAVSHDDGRHFQVSPVSALPFDSVDSMVAKGGRLFVADDTGRLWVSTDDTWTHFRRRDVGYGVSELKIGFQGMVMARSSSSGRPFLVELGQRAMVYAAARLPRDEVP